MQQKILQCNVVLSSPPLYHHLSTNYIVSCQEVDGEILIVSGQCN